MRKRLLLLLADHLRTVEEAKFNMSVWTCSTTACAIGHAENVPEIVNAGLAFTTGYDGVTMYPQCSKTGKTGMEAVAQIFTIEEHDVNYLFLPWSYTKNKATPFEVSERIESFVEQHS
jgi:hypothetical protein